MSSSISRRLQTLLSKSHKSFCTTTTTTSSSTSFTTRFKGPPEIQELVKRFKRNSRSIDFRRRVHYYDTVVRRLAALYQFNAIEHILEFHKKYEVDMATEGFGVRLIGLYGKAGMFEHAYKVFDEMPNFGAPRTVVSFNALLGACVNSRNFDKVGKFFVDLQEILGVEPDVVSYNTLIKGFSESCDFDSALKLIEEMEGGKIRPDVVSYNTVLEGYYKEDKFDEADALWRMMEEKGVVANTRTYNSKIRWLVRKDRVQEALELVEKKMVSENVNPDMFTYNSVIRGGVREENLEEAKMYYGKLVGDGFRLHDYTTFEMVIPFACEKDDIDFALMLCKHSIEWKVSINRSLMLLVVNALKKISRMEEATKLVKLVNSSNSHRYTLALPVVTP